MRRDTSILERRRIFECCARAAQGEAPFARMLPGAVDDWLEQGARHADDDIEPALVRLGLDLLRER